MIRSPNRTRRIAKWGGLGVCVVIGAAWVSSLSHDFGYRGRTFRLGLTAGIIYLWIQDSDRTITVTLGSNTSRDGSRATDWSLREQVVIIEPHWFKRSAHGPVIWLPATEHARAGFFSRLSIPLWTPLLLVAIPTFILWRRDRIPPGHCQQCGYDLTGNVSGRCPECGEPTQ